MVMNVNMKGRSRKSHPKDAGKLNHDLAVVLRSLLFILKYFYGVYVSNDELTTWQSWHSFLCKAYVVTWFILGLQMIFLSEATGITNFVYILSALASLVEIFVTYLLLNRRRKQLHQMLEALKDISRMTIEENLDSIAVKRSYAEARRLFILSKIVAVAFSICIPLQIFQDHERGSSGSVHLLVQTIVHSLDALLYLMLIAGFDFYLLSCHILCTAMSSIATSESRRALHFNKVRKFHRQVGDGIRVTDAVFKELFFVWNFAGYATILARLRRMNFHVINTDFMVLNVILLATHFVFFVVANANAGRVNEQIVTSLKEVFPMSDDESFIYRVQTAEDVKLKLYIQSILLAPPELTAWTSYKPSLSTIYEAIGGIVSYVLVLYRIPETENLSLDD